MRRARESSGKLNTYLSVVIFFGASLALGDYGIRFYVHILQIGVPHQVIAGFTEPITTKLVPAIAVVYLHQRYDVSLAPLQDHPYWFAFLGGLSLGVFERFLYFVVRDASISPGFVVAPGMHAINSILIAGLVFQSADNLKGYRFFRKLLAVTVLAMTIHVFWNTLGIVLIHQAFT